MNIPMRPRKWFVIKLKYDPSLNKICRDKLILIQLKQVATPNQLEYETLTFYLLKAHYSRIPTDNLCTAKSAH